MQKYLVSVSVLPTSTPSWWSGPVAHPLDTRIDADVKLTYNITEADRYDINDVCNRMKRIPADYGSGLRLWPVEDDAGVVGWCSLSNEPVFMRHDAVVSRDTGEDSKELRDAVRALIEASLDSGVYADAEQPSAVFAAMKSIGWGRRVSVRRYRKHYKHVTPMKRADGTPAGYRTLGRCRRKSDQTSNGAIRREGFAFINCRRDPKAPADRRFSYNGADNVNHRRCRDQSEGGYSWAPDPTAATGDNSSGRRAGDRELHEAGYVAAQKRAAWTKAAAERLEEQYSAEVQLGKIDEILAEKFNAENHEQFRGYCAWMKEQQEATVAAAMQGYASLRPGIKIEEADREGLREYASLFPNLAQMWAQETINAVFKDDPKPDYWLVRHQCGKYVSELDGFMRLVGQEDLLTHGRRYTTEEGAQQAITSRGLSASQYSIVRVHVIG